MSHAQCSRNDDMQHNGTESVLFLVLHVVKMDHAHCYYYKVDNLDKLFENPQRFFF